MTSDRPLVLVAFGITGDLMQLYILPALFDLYQKNTLPSPIHIIGVSRKSWDDRNLREYIKGVIEKRHPEALKGLPEFLELFQFHQGDVGTPRTYQELVQIIASYESAYKGKVNRLFYLSIAPDLYPQTLESLFQSGLARQDAGSDRWARILIEKPFGRDLTSALALTAHIEQMYDSNQIYRVDHYLMKDTSQQIVPFRLANSWFDEAAMRGEIARIDVRLLETLGTETRGEFYDAVGALRDMGQNHLPELLALPIMDLSAPLPAARAKILEKLRVMEIGKHTFRAQYQGYRNSKGVTENSQTETYFKVRAYTDLPVWKDIPVYMESGKCLKHSVKEVVVTLRQPSRILRFNYLHRGTISLEQGGKMDMVWTAKRESASGYENVIQRAISGDQDYFVSAKEIEAAWAFIDPIEAAWRETRVPLHMYEPGTDDVLQEAGEIE